MTTRRVSIAAIAAATLALADSAAAQGYPDRVIELIVPSTPGSSADILGRVLTDSMGAQFGQRFVVLNKAGGSSILGTAEVARAKPDGYTLMHGAAFSITVQPLTERQTGYTADSFTPICQTFKNDQVIVTRPGTYKSVADLLAASKAKDGGLNYGIPGLGTIPHLSMEELSQIAKVPFNRVPFRGPAESIQMTIAGQIEFAVAPLTAAANSGLVMPALFAEKRNPAIADVPTVKEEGFNVAPLSIGGLYAPAGLPADIKNKLEAACIAAKDSEPFQRIVKSTLQPSDYFADSAGFAANLKKDVEDKKRLLTALGMVKN
ncbi:MAG: tripartite tricarboxylate transporter substrate binding protein [Alphaproteobacteria bacterium]|nr:tripartite tricarboxylate transporter substrate binding protein [Alphaproteobacteria bacterium]